MTNIKYNETKKTSVIGIFVLFLVMSVLVTAAGYIFLNNKDISEVLYKQEIKMQIRTIELDAKVQELSRTIIVTQTQQLAELVLAFQAIDKNKLSNSQKLMIDNQQGRLSRAFELSQIENKYNDLPFATQSVLINTAIRDIYSITSDLGVINIDIKEKVIFNK